MDTVECGSTKESVTTSMIKKLLKGLGIFVPIFLRVLVGLALLANGTTWLSRPEPAVYLVDALTTALDGRSPVFLYAPFLKAIVIPHAGIFAFLVSWGETLSGFSLFFGFANRLGALVATFLFLNYGLMGGWLSLAGHSIYISMAIASVYWRTGRRFGFDRWLYAHWPNARIW